MLTALTVAYPSDAALRGLRGFADVAETEGQIDENNANHRAALEWLKAYAGWEPER